MFIIDVECLIIQQMQWLINVIKVAGFLELNEKSLETD